MNTARLKAKMDEVYVVQPNDLHIVFLTKLYKSTTGHLKRMPFLYIIPFSFVLLVILSILFGFSVVRLASFLQYGY